MKKTYSDQKKPQLIFGLNKMVLATEDVVLYSIIAFIVVENFIEIYLSMRQVSKIKANNLTYEINRKVIAETEYEN